MGKNQKKTPRYKLILIDKPRGRLKSLSPKLASLGIELVPTSSELFEFSSLLQERWDGIILRSKLADLIPKLRKKLGVRYLPIILVYRKGELNLSSSPLQGADDYIVLPLPPQEIAQRIRATIERRKKTVSDDVVQLGYKTLEQILTLSRKEKDDFQILRKAVLELEKLFPGSRCSVIMIDRNQGQAVVLADTSSKSPLDIPLNLKKYPEIRRVLITRKPLPISDVQRHPLLKEVKQFLATKSVYSMLVVPIFYLEEVIGVLFIRSIERKHIYFPIEIYFAQLICETLAVALRNLRLEKLAEAEAKEKKKALAQAQEKGRISRRLEKIFEHASDGLILVNQKGIITGVNQNFLRLGGYSRPEVIGKPLDHLLQLEKGKRKSLVRWIKAKKLSGASSLILKTNQGEEKFVTVHIEPLPGSKKEFLISLHDITDERKLSLELQRTKEFLEKLIQSSMEAIIAADMTGTIILFNKAAEELTGYKAEEVMGKKNIVDLYAPGGARAVMKKLRSPFYGGVGKLETTHNVLIGKDGSEIPINMTASIIYDDRGKELATVGLYQDLRERVEIEKKLRQAQERLLENQRRQVMMALAGATAHELNQPLTSILGYAQIFEKIKQQLEAKLKKDPVLKTFKNGIKTIQEQSERMAEVIKKLGELTEFETEQYIKKQKIIDLKRARRPQIPPEKLLAQTSEVFIVLNEDLIIENPQGGFEKIFGENPELKSLSRYLEGVNYARANEFLQEAFKNPGKEIELELKRADGEKRQVWMKAEKLEDNRLALLLKDITEFRQITKELEELKAFRSQMLANLPVPLIIYDQDGRINYLSREAEKLFGWSTEELKGKLPDLLIEDFDLSIYLEGLRTIKKEGLLEGKLLARNREGKNFVVYFFSGALRDTKGEVIGYTTLLIDLSEQRLLQQALQTKTKYLEIIQDNLQTLLETRDLKQALIVILDRLTWIADFNFIGAVFAQPIERGFYFVEYYPAKREHRMGEQRVFERMEQAIEWIKHPEIKTYAQLDEIKLPPQAPVDVKESYQKLKQEKVEAVASIPLKFQEEIIARLYLGHPQPGFFTPEILQELTPLLEQLTIALTHFRLYLDLEDEKKKLMTRSLFLQRILEQSHQLDPYLSEAELFSKFLDLFQEVFPRAHLWLAWKENEKFPLKAVSNFEEDILGKELNLTPELLEILTSSFQLVQPEPGKDLKGFLPDAQSLILAPIFTEQELSGILGLESHHRTPYTPEEEFLIQLFAQLLSILIPHLLKIRQTIMLRTLQETLIESAGAMIIMIDRERGVILVNRQLEIETGVSREEILKIPTEELWEKFITRIESPEGKPLDLETIRALAQKHRQMFSLRVVFRGADGREREGLFNISSFLNEKGELQGIIAIGQDLKPLRELEAQLLHSERLAGLGQMASGIAHELNNPLQAISTYCEMMKKRLAEIGEKDLEQRIDKVIEATERIQRLVKSLTSYVRPSKMVKEEVNLHKLVNDILLFSGYELRRGGVEIENLIPKDLPPLYAVKDQVEQVLINLMLNASQACAEKGGGKVRVRARKRKEGIELRVEDNGVGIPPEQMSKIFDPFFTTKPEGKGTGLGLNIVQSIVERHQGKIRVKSKPGEGTVFSILFPQENS